MTSHLLLYVGLFNNFKLKNAACSQYNLYPAGPPRQPSDRVARRPILNFILKHLVQFLILSLLVDLKQFCRSTKSMGVLRTWSKLYPGSTPGSTFIQSIRQFSASVVFLTQLINNFLQLQNAGEINHTSIKNSARRKEKAFAWANLLAVHRQSGLDSQTHHSQNNRTTDRPLRRLPFTWIQSFFQREFQLDGRDRLVTNYKHLCNYGRYVMTMTTETIMMMKHSSTTQQYTSKQIRRWRCLCMH